jgi:nucleotide-binding universal stress UspA family protein
MKTILVATDFSAASQNAVIFAGQLAKRLEAKIMLFHTFSIPTTVTDIALMMVSVEEMQRGNEDRVKNEADNLVSEFGIEVECLVRIGIPSDEIKILADERNADLVIMAIQGEDVPNKFIGSTTLNTIQKIKKPVLVIPDSAVFEEIKQVTYATDFSYSANPELFSVLIEIAKSFRSELHFIHIHKPEKKPEEKEAAAKSNIALIFAGIPHQFSNVEAESIMYGINGFTQKNKIQLLVMTMHKHNFIERVFGKNYTKEMAYETRIPLLILQGKE